MGRREQKIERERLQLHLSSLLKHGSVKYPIKTLNAENDSAVCDYSPAETMTSDLSLLTTFLQRDIEGESYLFLQCPPVLIHYYALRFSRYSSI